MFLRGEPLLLLLDRNASKLTPSPPPSLSSGLIPDMILYLSYWYKTDELPIRLSFFWVAQTSTTIIGSFLAFGLLHLRGLHGWAGWRYLFLVEGCITLAVGLFAAAWLPPR